MIPRTLLALACLALAAPACSHKSSSLTVPAASDPTGKDMVEGAVVAAAEKSGDVRLYKIVHVDDYPTPIGWEFHMIAYQPKGAPASHGGKVPGWSSFEEAAKAWESKSQEIAMPHVWVRWVNFKDRDHRVLTVEPLTDSERATYMRTKGIHSGPSATPPPPADSSQAPAPATP